MQFRILVLILLLIIGIGFISSETIVKQFWIKEKKTYVNKVTFIHYLDENIAIKEVQTGSIHTYFWRVPLEIVAQLKEDPNVKLYESPGGTYSLLINPAPTKDKFNPFIIREVRYAINYLLNRDYIVNEILRGYGIATTSVYSPYDPDYLVIAEELENLGIKYDPELAKSIIDEAMNKAGAERINGKWFFKGSPIKIKFFIRSDDPKRKALGEVLSTEIERIGFTVEKIYGDLLKAYDTVYGSDPKSGEWHIYTEGWGRSAFIKYDTVLPAQMYAPWFGYMPGFKEPTYWNYENSKLDEITKRIFIGNFSSKEERDSFIKEAVLLGINESVRVFIASIIEPYIVNKALEGVINDFGAGITVRWTLINARVSDSDLLKVGMKQIYQGAWNPIGGFNDFYSRKVWDCVSDPATFTHPHTGEIIPVRASWKVETMGPRGKLKVPAEAIVWDPYKEEWKNVGEGVMATSKVTFDLKYSNWHHGIPMRMSDILYGIYFFFEWGTNEGKNDPTFDPEYTSRVESMVKTFKGIKFLNENKVEVYVDYWHFDDSFIADYASVWASMPWEIMAAMEKVVLDKKFAFSNSASKALNLEWLSLIIKSNAEEIKKALIEFKSIKAIPKPLQGFITLEEAIKRYESSINWINTYGHAIISNGPFRLVEYNPEARTITIEAFNDPSYPFERNHWSSFETIKVAEIKTIKVPSKIIIGKEAKIELFIEVGGEPSNEAIVNYIIVNPEGKTIIKGSAKPSTPIGTFEILLNESMTLNLKTGSYRLKVLATSTKAIKPYIFETSLLVTSD